MRRFWRYNYGAPGLKGLRGTPDSSVVGGEKYYYEVGNDNGAANIRYDFDYMCSNSPQRM
jgi:hypothetical protein